MLLMLIEPKSDQTKTLLLEPMKGRKRRLYNKWHFKGLCEGGENITSKSFGGYPGYDARRSSGANKPLDKHF